MKRILFILTLAYLVAGCNNKNSFSIDGIIKGEAGKYIYIYRVDVNTPVFIDSAKIGKRGAFHFRIKSTEPDFFQLGFSTTNFITLLSEPGEKVNISFPEKNIFENYSITGSKGSQKIQELDANLAESKRKLDSLRTVYTNASKEPGFETKGPAIEAEFTNVIKAQRKKNIEFIINNINSLASIKALYQSITPDSYVLYEPHDLQYMKIVTDTLSRYYPNSKHVQALARDLNKELNKMYTDKLQQMAKDLPQTKLDPDLMSINGKRISLSSLHGKYVLLTFWSARSKECVDENLQLKEFYKKYSHKGFEIYQINLDENEKIWRAAVSFDELPWISTREDDPRNPVNAITFNVKSLPTNYLFDKEGNIVASNIHDRSLQLKLEQLFTN